MGIPQHVAIILDGNGRWAKSKGMPRNYGHAQGAKNVERICDAAYHMGIRYLTLYAFSTENWSRPKSEVDTLMRLLRTYLKNCLKTAADNNMRVHVIGERSRLPEELQDKIEELEEVSAKNTGLNLQIALNYGSRDEIVRSVRKLFQTCEKNGLKADEITEELLEEHLDTAGIPDPDLLIRTSGEQRLSNFLLWQLAYTEFYFTEVPWPAFTKEELAKAVEAYQRRDRRYGGLKEEQHV